MIHALTLKKIRKSKAFKITALLLCLEVIVQVINPPAVWALTSGPTQPEVEGFQPIGVSDMVDPFSGDFSYNIPLMSVGDYPLNLAYQSGVGMDDEASWAGLGWNVHTGAITRQMRGLPDDFWGDSVTRKVYMRDNLTVGAKVMLGFETFGLDLSDYGVDLGAGFDVSYNTYRGVALGTSTSVGIGLEGAGLPMNLGLSMSTGQDGLNISPNISFTAKFGSKNADARGSASLGFGFNINSRAGLSGMSLSHSSALSGTKATATKKNDKGIREITAKQSGSMGMMSNSSSVDFGSTTFTPQIDLPMKNFAASGRFKIGGAVLGQDIDATIVGYGSKQSLAHNVLINPSYGYMYAEKGQGNDEAIHDFNREKDGSFTKEKKNLPLTNHTYDIFSISAQGLGGSFRAYRNDAGYVYDKRAMSPSTSLDFGAEIGPGQLIDIGVDFTGNFLESESKAWTASNAAAQKLKFKGKQANDITENFHLKLTGEKIVNSDLNYYNQLRGNRPVKFDLDTDPDNFETPAYNKFVEQNGSKHTFSEPQRANRQQRNTAIYYFTKKEVLASAPYKARYISPHAKDHHIAEIVVVQPDGKRYVFGLAAYNTTQREISFNVGVGNAGSDAALTNGTSASSGLVQGVTGADLSPGGKKRGIDHYYDETVTTGYAHTWMLTEILSADYVDVTGDGPSADDLGNYTKFNYGRTESGDIVPDVQDFLWRTPIGNVAGTASYMEGLKTDLTDDKGNIVYGEKDIWYVHSIESKTQIAVFETSDRNDALGANILGEIQSGKRLKKLDKIKLYSKQEYDYDPIAAVPIKTVHFEYDYSLCKGLPNTIGSSTGKLTLKKVYFTYKNSNAGIFSPYEFSYRTHSNTGTPFTYKFGEVDRWNTYKPASQLPAGTPLTKSEYPYSVQNKAQRDDYSSAWHLNDISLPSGGKIHVNYESDDYAFVQNKDAMRMFKAIGLHKHGKDYTDGRIYSFPDVNTMRDSLVVQLDAAVANDTEFRTKYLTGYGDGNHGSSPSKYLYYRFQINVNEGLPAPEYEFVSGYAEIDVNKSGLTSPGSDKAYLKIKPAFTKISGFELPVSPFAFSAWQFSRISTPRKAYQQAEPTDPAIEQFIQTLASADMFAQLIQFFQGPNGRMLAQGFGSKMNTNASWVRLLEPDKNKLGGGNRVKDITISDEWSNVSPEEAGATYGQEFSYLNDQGYSSGVAAYESGVGADENPWRMPAFYSKPKQILIPDERYYLEEPFGESFFPSPSIGYSKVTIKDKVFDPNVTLNRTGKTVHEFYTAYDFPTQATYTDLTLEPRKSGILAQLLKINSRNYMTATQGYTVQLNDMHGKPKAQSMYAEGESSPFSYTKYHYKTQADGTLNNMADVIDREGKVSSQQIGVETDFIADMRQQSTTGQTISVTGNLATMLFGVPPVPCLIPSVFGSYATDKTRFRSAVTTKVVYSFGIQDRTETYDKGAYVETRITAFDGQTGEPLVQQLNNEYKDKYYKIDYPAHWAYSGMGQASQNIGYVFTDAHVSSSTGLITDDYVHAGDEVLPAAGPIYGRSGNAWTGNANTARLWISEDSIGGKYLIDYRGKKFIPPGTNRFTVIRSGHRNMQSTSIGSVTSTLSPLRLVSGQTKVVVDEDSKVIAASAVEFWEQWRTAYTLPTIKYDSTVRFEYGNQLLALLELLNAHIDDNDQLSGISNVNNNSLKTRLFGLCGEDAIITVDGEEDTEGFILNFNVSDACSCYNQTQIHAIDNFPPFTDWNNISYFKDELEVSSSQSLAYSYASLYEDSTHATLVAAVMNDNSERLFIIEHGCWGVKSDIIRGYNVLYGCKMAGDTINPYLQGILGNWRAKGDYFFMGDRNNVNASTAENLRNDGYIDNFLAFWQTPASSTDVWKPSSSLDLGVFENWNWKTRMTIYSPFGFDLENMNPLPAYSSAQYGYQNTLPTAVANNAQNKEIGYDGFEDYYPWLTQLACVRGHFKFEEFQSDISFTQAHTGFCSMGIANGDTLHKIYAITEPYGQQQERNVPYVLDDNDVLRGFSPNLGAKKRYVLSFWARTEARNYSTDFDYTGIDPQLKISGTSVVVSGSLKKSKLIEDWQRYELTFDIPVSPAANELEFYIANGNGQKIYVDDIRMHPYDANMKSFVYNMYDMRYLAQLDENNFATFYEYDEEGKLVRVKKETERGIMTLQENRNNMYKH